MREDGFTFQHLFQQLPIFEAEQAIVVACFKAGLRACEVDRHSNPLAQYPISIVQARMQRPFVFGFGVVEVVRQAQLSIATQQAIVRMALQQIDPLTSNGIPYGLMIMLSFLAKTGALNAVTFDSVMGISDRTETLAWQPTELEWLLQWLVVQPVSPSTQCRWLQSIASQLSTVELGEGLIAFIAQHPQLPEGFKQQVYRALMAEDPIASISVEPQVLQARVYTDEMVLATLITGVPQAIDASASPADLGAQLQPTACLIPLSIRQKAAALQQ